MLSEFDALILISGIFLKPEIHPLIDKSGLKPPFFDRGSQFEFDLLALEYINCCYEAKEHVSLNVFRQKLQIIVKDKWPQDQEMQDQVTNLFEQIAVISPDELPNQLVQDTLQKLANLQFSKTLGSMASSLARMSPEKASARVSDMAKSLTIQTTQKMSVKPLEMLEDDERPMRIWPTGVDFFDIMIGGVAQNRSYGLLAPSAGGKTTFALQMAFSWMQKSPKHKVAYFMYEQSMEGDIKERLLCLAAGGTEHMDAFKGKSFKQLNPALQDRCRRFTTPLRDRFFAYPLADKGDGGMEDILRGLAGDGLLKTCEESDPAEDPPVLVLIDWLEPFVMRRMAKDGKDVSDSSVWQNIAAYTLDQLKAQKTKYNFCPFVFHQLSNVASAAKPSRVPHWTDAHKLKSFAHYFDFVFAVGTTSSDCVGYFAASKARGAAKAERLVKLDGGYCRFLDAENKYMISNGKILDKTLPIPAEKQNQPNKQASALAVNIAQFKR